MSLYDEVVLDEEGEEEEEDLDFNENYKKNDQQYQHNNNETDYEPQASTRKGLLNKSNNTGINGHSKTNVNLFYLNKDLQFKKKRKN